MTGSGKTALPAVGDEACFSVHSTQPAWQAILPRTDPWTHQPPGAAPGPAPIEDENSGD